MGRIVARAHFELAQGGTGLGNASQAGFALKAPASFLASARQGGLLRHDAGTLPLESYHRPWYDQCSPG
jgi:hypothetical protein